MTPSVNAFLRYKRLIGGRLRSRNNEAQATEVRLAVNTSTKCSNEAHLDRNRFRIEPGSSGIGAFRTVMQQRRQHPPNLLPRVDGHHGVGPGVSLVLPAECADWHAAPARRVLLRCCS